MRTGLALGGALPAALLMSTAALAGGGYGSPPGASKELSYRATLSPRQEVPAPDAPARAAGVFTATVTKRGGKANMRWTLTFRRLSGKAVGAHIHAGKVGVAGPFVLFLCGPCKTGANGYVPLTRAQATLLRGPGAYVNIHTQRNQDGELRGQVRLVGTS